MATEQLVDTAIPPMASDLCKGDETLGREEAPPPQHPACRRADAYLLRTIACSPITNRPCRMLMQSHNGPCALIALANALLLNGTLRLGTTVNSTSSGEFVEADELLVGLGSTLVGVYYDEPERMLQLTGGWDGDLVEHVRKALDGMQGGFCVNPHFDDIFHFGPTIEAMAKEEESSSASPSTGSSIDEGAIDKQSIPSVLPELLLFELAKTRLCHGMIVGEEMRRVVGDDCYMDLMNASYDSAMDAICADDKLENSPSTPSSAIMKVFIEDNADLMTPAGLVALKARLPHGVLHILFHNAHYSVVINIPGGLFRLVTDAGHHSYHPAVAAQEDTARTPTVDGPVWESVEQLDGNTHYYDAYFRCMSFPTADQPAISTAPGECTQHCRKQKRASRCAVQ